MILAERFKVAVGELFDAQADALAVHIYGQHHRFHFLPLGVFAQGGVFVAVGDIGGAHQALNLAGQFNKQTVLVDGAHDALDFVALAVGGGEILPRILLALLHAQRNAAAVAVYFQHHHFNFVAGFVEVFPV